MASSSVRIPPALTYALFLGAAHAADVTWTGSANHEWLNPANWSSNPDPPAEGLGSAGDTLRIDSIANAAVFDADDGTRTYRSVRVGFNAAGRLDVTGGTLNGDHTIPTIIGRAGNAGTLVVSGTGHFRAGHIVQIGIDDGSTGGVAVSGGTFTAFRGAMADGLAAETSIHIGAGGSATGTLDLTGGGLFTRFGVLVGRSGASGSGTFRVTGGAWNATIGGNNGLNPANSGFWVQRGNATLAATVDSADFSLGTIHIHHAGSSFLTFETGALLDLGFTGPAPEETMSWELMTFDNGASLTDGGLALAPGNAAAGWSFAFVDSDSDTRPDTLRVTFTPPAVNTPLTVDSIAGLKAAASLNYHDITMAPGTYWLAGPSSKPSPHPDHPIFLDLSGTRSSFDFTGVTILVDTRDLRGYGRAFGHGDTVRVLQISGKHVTVDGLALRVENVALNGTDPWGYPREYTADWSTTLVEIVGDGTLVKNSSFTTRGSYPYGFGDAFGKGGRPADANGVTNAAFIDHRKHSGIRLGRGVNGVTLDNVNLHMRSFGHGIFFQEGAGGILLRDCSVLGDTMAESDNIIAHPVYQQWGAATYREKIPAGIRTSKHEDGIRVYTNEGHATNGWPRYVNNVTIDNCVVERMRDGLALGDMTGDLLVTGTAAWECEQGFTPSQLAATNTFTGCKGDARNGPLVFFRRSATNVTMSCELAGDTPPQGDWPIALVSGNGHHITLTRTSAPGTYPETARVCLSQGWREWRHAPPADIDALGSANSAAATTNCTILNQTGQPLVFGANANNNTATSDGGVIHKGSANLYAGTTLVPAPDLVTDTWGTYIFFSGLQTVRSPASLGGTNAEDGGTHVMPGAILSLAPGTSIPDEPLVLSGTFVSDGQAGTGTRWGVNDTSGDIALSGDANIGVGVAGNQLLVGGIHGTGNLTKSGPGLLVMENGANTFVGDLIVSEGGVSAHANKVPGNLLVAAGAGFGQQSSHALHQDPHQTTTLHGTLDLNRRGTADANPHTATVGRLLGDGRVTATSTAVVHTLEITSETAASTFGGTIDGNVSLVKSGTAVLTLHGTTSHSGPTLVQTGTLEVNGTLGVSSDVIVSSGATLTGTGTVEGHVTLASGATAAPGNSVGILATGPQTWHGGAMLAIQIADATGEAGSSWDLLEIGGTLTLHDSLSPADPFHIGLTGSSFLFDTSAPRAWRIVSTAGIEGDFDPDSFRVDTPAPGGGSFRIAVSGNDLLLVFDPPPFTLWKLSHGIPAGTSATDDPDGNGLSLLLEYALGIAPGGQDIPTRIEPAGASPATFRFFRARGDLTYQVMISRNLVDWTPVATDPGDVGTGVAVELAPENPENPAFFRLRVSTETE